MNKKILVTGAGGASGLSTIRILKETSSYHILAADAAPDASGLYLGDEKFIVPKATESHFLTTMAQLVEEKGIDLILPNVDEELEVFATHTDLIPQVLISPLQTIKVCNDKLKTIQYFKNLIPTPTVFSSVEDVSDTSFPVFVKPRVSRGSRNTYIANTPRQLATLLKYLATINLPSTKLLKYCKLCNWPEIILRSLIF